MAATLSLTRMRRVATGALIVCVIGMVVCRIFEPEWPWLAWPRAFFEAGTVGALADWFAVVALFRHPLGLPIPHTAILPKNKGRVAESLAGFIETSFLTEAQLGPRFCNLDYAGFASLWLAEHADFLTEKATGFAPGILAGISDEQMTALLAERARTMVRSVQLAPLAGEGLSLFVQNGRDREIYGSILKAAEDLILSHREMIQTKIQEEIPIPVDLIRNLPGLKVLEPALDQLKSHLAAAVATRTIEKIQNVLRDAETIPDHSLWQTFDQKLRQFIADLNSSPELARKIGSVQEAFAASAVVEDFSAKAWMELKTFLLRDCEAADSAVRAKLREAVLTVAKQLEENETARREVNGFLSKQVLQSLLAARPHARTMILSTIENWESREMAEKLEATVGPDLQFIRLNGTIIGGLIGVAIHAGFAFFGT